MSKYIEREKACDLLLGFHKPYGVGNVMWINIAQDIVDELEKIPAADVRSERHGHWVYGEFDIPHCSECGKEKMPNDISRYCPDCGARMDGEDGEK